MPEFPHANELSCSPRLLAAANCALREGRWIDAMQGYLTAVRSEATLARLIAPNIDLLRRRHLRAREASDRLRIGVCGWDLAHNAAGRVYTLAQLHARSAEVEIIGFLFPQHGTKIWAPIRGELLPPLRTVVVDNEARFLDLALELVMAHPYDVVHLSKPRMPNIFIGLLYRMLWGARVIMDVDDEELAFVSATSADALRALPLPPERAVALDGAGWTHFAVSLATAFDAITVANPALQRRYGGLIVPHARDGTRFVPATTAERFHAKRSLGLGTDRRVVLFLGTARKHKGLLRLAKALAETGQRDLTLAVFGDIEDAALREALLSLPHVECVVHPILPIGDVPRVLAAADCCVLLQDTASIAARFQSPAKISDALAMALPVAVFSTPALEDFVAAGAVVGLDEPLLTAQLNLFLRDQVGIPNRAGRKYFDEKLSFTVVGADLRRLTISLPALRLTKDADGVARSLVDSHSLLAHLVQEADSLRSIQLRGRESQDWHGGSPSVDHWPPSVSVPM